jgi:hypothetical protein
MVARWGLSHLLGLTPQAFDLGLALDAHVVKPMIRRRSDG